MFALDAGMFRPPTDSRVDDQTTRPTTKPTQDPKGDGTPCSGAKCFIEGMCRSNAGLCGAGIQFCNPKSVWEPNCPEETAANPVAPGPTTYSPTTSSWPSVVPTLSNVPSRTNSPSSFPEASNATTVPVSVFCNEAGSVGVTARETTQSTYISFTYALKSKNGAMPVDASLIAEFEQELQARLSCVYFDFPCLLCSGGNRKLFTELEIYDSSVVGISSSPKDQPTSTGEKWMNFNLFDSDCRQTCIHKQKRVYSTGKFLTRAFDDLRGPCLASLLSWSLCDIHYLL